MECSWAAEYQRQIWHYLIIINQMCLVIAVLFCETLKTRTSFCGFLAPQTSHRCPKQEWVSDSTQMLLSLSELFRSSGSHYMTLNHVRPVCCCFSLAVARRDTWNHRMSSWLQIFSMLDIHSSASLFDASLNSSQIKIAERWSPASFPRSQPQLWVSSLTCCNPVVWTWL